MADPFEVKFSLLELRVLRSMGHEELALQGQDILKASCVVALGVLVTADLLFTDPFLGFLLVVGLFSVAQTDGLGEPERESRDVTASEVGAFISEQEMLRLDDLGRVWLESKKGDRSPGSLTHVLEVSPSKQKLTCGVIWVVVDSRKVSDAQTDVAEVMEDRAGQDGVLGVSFPVVRVKAVPHWIWALFAMMTFPGAVATSFVTGKGNPVGEVEDGWDIQSVGSDETIPDLFVVQLKFGSAEILFLAVRERPSDVVQFDG